MPNGRSAKRSSPDAARSSSSALPSNRWAQWWPAVCDELEHDGHPGQDLGKAPQVLGIGDLHVENFGTWRDAESRLVWGINDFDEACCLPYTHDLVRLAASGRFAIQEGHQKANDAAGVVDAGPTQTTLSAAADHEFRAACQSLLAGYGEAWIASSGRSGGGHSSSRRTQALPGYGISS